MSFSQDIRNNVLVASARRCCICREFKGVKVELHHIKPKKDGGTNDFDNAILLCFDCHAAAGHYNDKHPKGVKFSPIELKLQRDDWYKIVQNNKLSITESTDFHRRYLHLRNPNFTGREQLLAEMNKCMIQSKGITLIALVGLGGIGKTQIANEYSHCYADHYNVIWWIRASDSATIAEDFSSLAIALLLAAENEHIEFKIKRVIEWLQTNSDWLLIFDNVQNPIDLEDYYPKIGKGHIIITSRNTEWSGYVQIYKVTTLTISEALEFINKRTSIDKKEDAKKLAEILEYLPLALEQACSYILVQNIPICNYLQLFDKFKLQLFKGKGPDDHPDSVLITWSINFKAVENESTDAITLLKLLAFLAPNYIPKDLFIKFDKNYTEQLKEQVKSISCETDDIYKESLVLLKAVKPLENVTKSELALNELIAKLRKYSLVDTDGEMLSMHSLVQEVIRNNMNPADHVKFSALAVTLVFSRFSYEDDIFELYKKSKYYLQHALVASKYAEDNNVLNGITGVLLNQLGLILQMHGRLLDAKICLERAIMMGKKLLGEEHDVVGVRYGNLGSVLDDLDDPKGASDAILHAMKIHLKVHGEKHVNYAKSLNKLGMLLWKGGDYENAEKHIKHALSIYEHNNILDNYDISVLKHNLGLILIENDKNHEAIIIFEEILGQMENKCGSKHPFVAAIYDSLGTALLNIKEFEKAKLHFLNAYNIDREIFRPNCSQVGRDLEHLGVVELYLGNLKLAEEHLIQSVDIRIQIYGVDHTITRNTKEWLDHVQSKLLSNS